MNPQVVDVNDDIMDMLRTAGEPYDFKVPRSPYHIEEAVVLNLLWKVDLRLSPGGFALSFYHH